MSPCAKCVNYQYGPLGAYCAVEREIAKIHGVADLGFPVVGDSCPHWEPKEEDDEK